MYRVDFGFECAQGQRETPIRAGKDSPATRAAKDNLETGYARRQGENPVLETTRLQSLLGHVQR
eukprot:3586264-Pyramimonas_sp.AAC.1